MTACAASSFCVVGRGIATPPLPPWALVMPVYIHAAHCVPVACVLCILANPMSKCGCRINTWARHRTTETVLNNDWRLAVGGWWLVTVGSWRQLAQLVVGSWWWLAVGGWQLVVGGALGAAYGLSLTKNYWASQGHPCCRMTTVIPSFNTR